MLKNCYLGCDHTLLQPYPLTGSVILLICTIEIHLTFSFQDSKLYCLRACVLYAYIHTLKTWPIKIIVLYLKQSVTTHTKVRHVISTDNWQRIWLRAVVKLESYSLHNTREKKTDYQAKKTALPDGLINPWHGKACTVQILWAQSSQSIKIGSNQVIFIDWQRKSLKIDKLNCCLTSILSIFHDFNDL